MAKKYRLFLTLVISIANAEPYHFVADRFTYPYSLSFEENEVSLLRKLRSPSDNDVPEVRLYYESMCPGCRHFDFTHFAEPVAKLGPHLHIQTYPYGKASTTVNYNGTVEFTCQHGPAECYGNTLHACALDSLPDRDKALLFNACLMELERADNGSDDAAADECGSKMQIDPKEIKECAKGDRGVELMRHIGEESVNAHYTSLPHLLISGEHWTGAHEDLIKDVCAAFRHPPEPCQDAAAI